MRGTKLAFAFALASLAVVLLSASAMATERCVLVELFTRIM